MNQFQFLNSKIDLCHYWELLAFTEGLFLINMGRVLFLHFSSMPYKWFSSLLVTCRFYSFLWQRLMTFCHNRLWWKWKVEWIYESSAINSKYERVPMKMPTRLLVYTTGSRMVCEYSSVWALFIENTKMYSGQQALSPWQLYLSHPQILCARASLQDPLQSTFPCLCV